METLALVDDLNSLKATRARLAWEETRHMSRVQEIIKSLSSLDQQIDLLQDLLDKQRKQERQPWFCRLFTR